MNQGLHRLVFNRHRGMAVAVFEGARSQGKAGRLGLGLAAATAALALGSPIAAQRFCCCQVIRAKIRPATNRPANFQGSAGPAHNCRSVQPTHPASTPSGRAEFGRIK